MQWFDYIFCRSFSDIRLSGVFVVFDLSCRDICIISYSVSNINIIDFIAIIITIKTIVCVNIISFAIIQTTTICICTHYAAMASLIPHDITFMYVLLLEKLL